MLAHRRQTLTAGQQKLAAAAVGFERSLEAELAALKLSHQTLEFGHRDLEVEGFGIGCGARGGGGVGGHG